MADAATLLAAQWLDKARRDLASAVRLLAGDPPFRDTAVYHCQQAAEKALKGYLTAQGQPPRRVHDLMLLLDACAALDPTFDCLADAAALLTPYGTAFRYPGDATEPDPGDAQEAVDAAQAVLDRVVRCLASTVAAADPTTNSLPRPR